MYYRSKKTKSSEAFVQWCSYLINKLSHPWCVTTFFVGITIFLGVSYASYHDTDPSLLCYSPEAHVANKFGLCGAQVAAISFYLFGMSAWLFGILCAYISCIRLFSIARCGVVRDRAWVLLAAPYAMSLVCAWYHLEYYASTIPGGLFGAVCLRIATRMFDTFGTGLMLHTMLIAMLMLMFPIQFFALVRLIVAAVRTVCSRHTLLYMVTTARWIIGGMCSALKASGAFVLHMLTGSSKILGETQTVLTLERIDMSGHDMATEDTFLAARARMPQQEVKATPSEHTIVDAHKSSSLEKTEDVSEEKKDVMQPERGMAPAQPYALPKTSLFLMPKKAVDEANRQELRERATVLENKLERFGIMGRVSAIKEGPVVTLFEYEPQSDTKLSKIIALEDDLAMALQALSIRIIAPIPGRSVVGFEVANKHRHDVLFATIVRNTHFVDGKAALPLILGEDTIGNHVIVDLARMPHLLVAGSTGSGKSVALNAMLISMLCKLSPDDLKLILIDPKRLEFAPYADIPHLLFPIVTDPRRAAPVLAWVVRNMEKRYDTMAHAGVRNIGDYNNAQDRQGLPRMPYIVVVIDELADLMMTAAREVEDLIARIAQMARAAGIHLLLATQRPSVDVITGLIKVNFPSRISFRVTSKIDSRTILDLSGAEKLLGRGDMLFLDGASAHVKRVHGAYVSDKEIEAIVTHVRSQRQVEYLDENQELAQGVVSTSPAEDDLFDDVVAFVRQNEEVSISLLQRRFRIGFNRSARLVDLLESHGLIMPSENGKTRKVIR